MTRLTNMMLLLMMLFTVLHALSLHSRSEKDDEASSKGPTSIMVDDAALPEHLRSEDNYVEKKTRVNFNCNDDNCEHPQPAATAPPKRLVPIRVQHQRHYREAGVTNSLSSLDDYVEEEDTSSSAVEADVI